MSRTFWTTDLVIKEANKYSSRKEFKANARGAFNYAYTNGLLDTVFKPLNRTRWTKELAIQASEKYTNRNRFKTGEA